LLKYQQQQKSISNPDPSFEVVYTKTQHGKEDNCQQPNVSSIHVCFINAVVAVLHSPLNSFYFPTDISCIIKSYMRFQRAFFRVLCSEVLVPKQQAFFFLIEIIYPLFFKNTPAYPFAFS
jgi:hypothetical protein